MIQWWVGSFLRKTGATSNPGAQSVWIKVLDLLPSEFVPLGWEGLDSKLRMVSPLWAGCRSVAWEFLAPKVGATQRENDVKNSPEKRDRAIGRNVIPPILVSLSASFWFPFKPSKTGTFRKTQTHVGIEKADPESFGSILFWGERLEGS